MVREFFDFLCQLFIMFCMFEIAIMIFVSVHEAFVEKRAMLRKYYNDKRKGGGSK